MKFQSYAFTYYACMRAFLLIVHILVHFSCAPTCGRLIYTMLTSECESVN